MWVLRWRRNDFSVCTQGEWNIPVELRQMHLGLREHQREILEPQKVAKLGVGLAVGEAVQVLDTVFEVTVAFARLRSLPQYHRSC